MTKASKIWIWFALALGAATTVMNATEGRWPSVAIAIVALIGLCILLFTEKKLGYYIVCACYLCSFVVGVSGAVMGGAGVLIGIIMSFIGSMITPGITYLFIRKRWSSLK